MQLAIWQRSACPVASWCRERRTVAAPSRANQRQPIDVSGGPSAGPIARFDRVGYAVLVFAILLIAGSLGQKVYRLTLPTDGWAFIHGDVGGPDQDRPIYTSNLLGEPSPILPGDKLLGVEGISFEELSDRALRFQAVQLSNWQAGESVRYTVERDGQALELDVPLYRWTAGVVLRLALRDLGLLASLPLVITGWFVFLRRPGERAAYPLLLFSTSLLVVSISTTVTGVGLPELVTSNILLVATFFSNLIWAFVMFPSLLLLTLTFPRPKWFVKRYPRSTVVVLYGFVVTLVALFGPIAMIGWLTVLGMALLSVVALGHSLVTVSDPVGRAQTRWAVTGLAVMVIGFILPVLGGLGLVPAPPEWVELIWFPVLLTVATLGFAIAILRYRLFDIDIIINRTLVYAVLTALLLGTYSVSVVTLQSIFRALTGQDSSLTIVISTLLVAALFQPLRTRVQRFIDRRFYRRRYNAAQTLTEFGARVRNEIDLTTVVDELVTVTRDTMQPATISVWLPPPPDQHVQVGSSTPRVIASSRHVHR
jgi:hypothetical protein